ncbi:hypothetical protein BDV98DRAFT_252362 [Pterulicium gracile]|uniref:Uncharacterized protein n=1 Tax=Pterulicium gracile TaxID=1884261 RepID=A0A5C3Q7X3_9AGAR|nr:hypothetical protein BDV98DRAFT_252362 [Pterula gracilis]
MTLILFPSLTHSSLLAETLPWSQNRLLKGNFPNVFRATAFLHTLTIILISRPERFLLTTQPNRTFLSTSSSQDLLYWVEIDLSMYLLGSDNPLIQSTPLSISRITLLRVNRVISTMKVIPIPCRACPE